MRSTPALSTAQKSERRRVIFYNSVREDKLRLSDCRWVRMRIPWFWEMMRDYMIKTPIPEQIQPSLILAVAREREKILTLRFPTLPTNRLSDSTVWLKSGNILRMELILAVWVLMPVIIWVCRAEPWRAKLIFPPTKLSVAPLWPSWVIWAGWLLLYKIRLIIALSCRILMMLPMWLAEFLI